MVLAAYLEVRSFEKMKILVLSDLWVPFPGGAERFMQNIAWALKQRGAEIQVVTLYGKLARSENGVPVKAMWVRGDTPHDECWRILDAEILAYNPDVILTHQLFPDKFRVELAARGIPVVQVVHAAPRWSYIRFAVYNSEHTAKRNDAKPEDMVIIPPAFEDCVAPFHGKAIGFIKPVEHKGIDLVHLLALALPHRHFVILRGEWWHFDKLVDLPNVEYMAPVDHMRDFYQRCRLVLVPSLYEDAGTVPQEAAINGLPCLSSIVGGLVETNGGILLSLDGGPGPWIGAIETLLSNEGLYGDVVNDQRARVKSFDWENKFNDLHRRLEALCPRN